MTYIYESDGEYKGFGKRDKYKPRFFKVKEEGVFECYEKKKCKITINLLKEQWSELKEVAGEGKNCKACWQFMYNGKQYNFASPAGNDRAEILKTLTVFADKQKMMVKAIEDIGKYNRAKPNNDDFKEVQYVFDNSIFAKPNKKARNKGAAQYWKNLKKDPKWKIDLYLLKEAHLPKEKNDMTGFSNSGGSAAVEEKKEETKEAATVEEKEAPKVATDATTEPKAVTPTPAKAEQKSLNIPQDFGYSGKKPNDAVYKTVNKIFEYSKHSSLNGLDAKQKRKKAAQYWKDLKKDKQWATTMTDFRNLHEPHMDAPAYEGKKPNDSVYKEVVGIFEKSKHKSLIKFDQNERRKQCADYWKNLKKDKEWVATMTAFAALHKDHMHHTIVTQVSQIVLDIEDNSYDDLGANANPFSLEPAEEEKKEVGEPNMNPLILASLEELLLENGSFTQQLGAEALNIRYDLVANNELCQIGIGMGIVKGEDEEEEEGVDDTPAGWSKHTDPDGRIYYQHLATSEITWTKPTLDEYKINKRPLQDSDDDLVPNITHDGTIGKEVTFQPELRDFSIALEIKCGNIGAGNVMFSNGTFEYIAPRPGSKRVAVRMIQKGDTAELFNVGETQLSAGIWYHIVIVCYRANDEDKRPKTDFKVYLNGVVDGELSIKKESEGGVMSALGGLFGKKKKAPITYTPHIGASPVNGDKFYGAIKNVQIFYSALEMADVKTLAYKKENMSYMAPSMISYDKDSLRVAVPQCDMRYSGPDMLKLPSQLQRFKPDSAQSFTVCAWIYCTRIGAQNGSVIVSNMNESKIQWDSRGFELVCPTAKSHVIGLRCTDSSSILPIGTREIKINKFYHIAVTVARVITRGAEPDQTDIVVYVNGKNDGVYNFKKCKDYYNSKSGKGFWTVGHNSTDESGTRFDGSIADVRFFFRALAEAEIACVYGACLKERRFKKGETVYYLSKNKIKCPKCHTVYEDWSTSFCGDCGSAINQSETDSNIETDSIANIDCLQTPIPNAQWRKATFAGKDLMKGEFAVTDGNNGQRRVCSMNEVICEERKLLSFIAGTETQRIANLGGWIYGCDFDGSTFKIYSTNREFLKYICKPSSMSALIKVEPFQKYEFERMLHSPAMLKYCLNRLLYGAYVLLKQINDPISKKQQFWNYFNEFILPWDAAWKDLRNFALLQKVAENLQKKYKKMQFAVFDGLTANGESYALFDLKSFMDAKYDAKVGLRQDGFGAGSIGTECDHKLWTAIDETWDETAQKMRGSGKPLFQVYDTKVAAMLLWGRCLVLQAPFQSFLQTLYADTPYEYGCGPQKTYERMMEKCVEYRDVDQKPFPCANSICDINRCSILCDSLADVYAAYQVLDTKCDKAELTIERVKNRFLPEFRSEETGGYRDMLVNCLFTDKGSGLSAICEVQFHLRAYEKIKHLQHKYYKIQRAVKYKSLLQNYEAAKFRKANQMADGSEEKKEDKH